MSRCNASNFSIVEFVDSTNAAYQMIFPKGHVIGLVIDNGIEILIHIGTNTFQLGGKGFKTLVKKFIKLLQAKL